MCESVFVLLVVCGVSWVGFVLLRCGDNCCAHGSGDVHDDLH